MQSGGDLEWAWSLSQQGGTTCQHPNCSARGIGRVGADFASFDYELGVHTASTAV